MASPLITFQHSPPSKQIKQKEKQNTSAKSTVPIDVLLKWICVYVLHSKMLSCICRARKSITEMMYGNKSPESRSHENERMDFKETLEQST